MAAPAVASTASNAGSASTITVTKPTGTASGDVLYAAVWHYDTSTSMTPPAGWTTLLAETGGGQPSNDIYMSTYRLVAGGSEPANYTWTAGTTVYLVGAIVRITGADTTTPEDGTTTFNEGQGTTVTATGVTTTGPDRLILIWTAGYNNALSSAYSGYTQQGVYDTVCFSHTIDQASAGSTGNPTATKTSDSWSASLVAIASPSSGATVTPNDMAVATSLDVVTFPPPPDAVTDLAGTAGDTQVALTWTAPADNGNTITDYIVQYRTAATI